MSQNPGPNGFWRDIWNAAKTEEDKATVHNYAFDKRLPAGFIEDLQRLMDSLPAKSGDAAFHAFKIYAGNRRILVGENPQTTFCDSSVNSAGNGSNVIPRNTPGLPRQLVHIFNLTSVLRWAADLEKAGLLEEQKDAIQASLEEFGVAISDDRRNFHQVSNRVDPSREDDRDRILRLYRAIAIHLPKHPVWAAAWEDLSPLVRKKEPLTFLEAVGLPHPGQDRWTGWLIVLKYSINEVPELVRPSQQEAGWFAHHFPSPPCHPCHGGGITMLLGSLSPAAVIATEPDPPKPRIVREFIHRQLPFALPAGHVPGQSILVEWHSHHRLTVSKATGDLAGLRKRHHDRLLRLYQNELSAWMPSPSEFS